MFDALKDKPGRKVIFIIWAGRQPVPRSPTSTRKRYGIEIATGGNILPAMAAYKALPGMEGAHLLLLRHPEEPGEQVAGGRAPEALQVAARLLHRRRHGAGIAMVEAMKKAGGDTDTEKLIAAMEGMSFETPKGKMTFRKEDHQAMQSMYHFKIKVDPEVEWACRNWCARSSPRRWRSRSGTSADGGVGPALAPRRRRTGS